MPDGFIDKIIQLAGDNDWCLKFGCTTCGGYKFRTEIECAAAD